MIQMDMNNRIQSNGNCQTIPCCEIAFLELCRRIPSTNSCSPSNGMVSKWGQAQTWSRSRDVQIHLVFSMTSGLPVSQQNYCTPSRSRIKPFKCHYADKINPEALMKMEYEPPVDLPCTKLLESFIECINVAFLVSVISIQIQDSNLCQLSHLVNWPNVLARSQI